jgi:hypothetical protein
VQDAAVYVAACPVFPDKATTIAKDTNHLMFLVIDAIPRRKGSTVSVGRAKGAPVPMKKISAE